MTQTARLNRTNRHLSHSPCHGRECEKPQSPMRDHSGLTRVATWVLTLGLMSLGLGGIGSGLVHANPPSQNSGYVADVQFWKDDGGLAINLELQNNESSPFVSDAKIQPIGTSLHLRAGNKVKCDHNIGDGITQDDGDFSHAFVFWGTVHLDGNSIIPTEAPWATEAEGVNGMTWDINHGWQDNPSDPWFGNTAPLPRVPAIIDLNIPLAKIKDGSASIRFRPVEVFLQLVDKHVQEGGQRLNFLQQDHTFTVIHPMSLSGFCENYETGGSGGGYDTRNMPITVKYHGDPDLMADPVSEVEQPDDLQHPFQVTAASVTTQFWDENYEGQCPTDLDFSVSIEAVGQGIAEYRMVNHLGAKSPIHHVWFNNEGERHDTFSHEVGNDTVGGFEGEAADDILNPIQPAGPIDGKAIAPSDKQFDSWRIEIVSPNALVSDEEFYNWTCTPASADIDGPDGLDGPSPHPTSRTGSGGLTAN